MAHKQPFGLAVFIGLSFSGVLAVLLVSVARLMVYVLGLDLMLKVLGS